MKSFQKLIQESSAKKIVKVKDQHGELTIGVDSSGLLAIYLNKEYFVVTDEKDLAQIKSLLKLL